MNKSEEILVGSQTGQYITVEGHV